ncbi:MAG TPA: hypothetical protein VGD29_31090 [Actinoplanes sp.]
METDDPDPVQPEPVEVDGAEVELPAGSAHIPFTCSAFRAFRAAGCLRTGGSSAETAATAAPGARPAWLASPPTALPPTGRFDGERLGEIGPAVTP